MVCLFVCSLPGNFISATLPHSASVSRSTEIFSLFRYLYPVAPGGQESHCATIFVSDVPIYESADEAEMTIFPEFGRSM